MGKQEKLQNVCGDTFWKAASLKTRREGDDITMYHRTSDLRYLSQYSDQYRDYATG
jgi:hypothetical protein